MPCLGQLLTQSWTKGGNIIQILVTRGSTWHIEEGTLEGGIVINPAGTLRDVLQIISLEHLLKLGSALGHWLSRRAKPLLTFP